MVNIKHRALILLIALLIFVPSLKAEAFWIWTPKSKKLENPKYTAKDTPELQFDWAMKFFKEKDYKRAAEEFSSLVTHYKDSDLAPEAQYYEGRSYEELGKYYPAFQAYQKVIDVYPYTKRINEIIEKEFNLGKMLYKRHRGKFMGKEIMTDLDRAVEIFQQVRDNAPFGEYTEEAQFMIGECFKKSEQYNEAKKAFQKVVDDYPRGALAEKAKYEVAQCTYLASLKADYDQKLTDQAIREFKRIAEDKRGLDESKEAEEAVIFLENKKAESIFKIAKFYEKQKHYKSAAIYYNEIILRYPRSSFRELAASRLEKIKKFIKEE